MARWAPDAALRLERAAVDLIAEHGFTEVTVPQIAARAGLTTRTFFRHFADKREVLFLRERELPAVVASLLADAPAGLGPLDLAMHGLETIAAGELTGWRDDLLHRREILRSDPQLRERELLKRDVLGDAISRAIAATGAGVDAARATGAVAVLIFDTALDAWLDEPEPSGGPGSPPPTGDRGLVQHLRRARRQLHDLGI